MNDTINMKKEQGRSSLVGVVRGTTKTLLYAVMGKRTTNTAHYLHNGRLHAFNSLLDRP